MSRSMRCDSQGGLVSDGIVENERLGIFEGLNGVGGVCGKGGDGVFVGVCLGVGDVLSAGKEGVDVIECVAGGTSIETDVGVVIV